jgi:hypothetical protein
MNETAAEVKQYRLTQRGGEAQAAALMDERNAQRVKWAST